VFLHLASWSEVYCKETSAAPSLVPREVLERAEVGAAAADTNCAVWRFTGVHWQASKALKMG
jgi:hypothetical protein